MAKQKDAGRLGALSREFEKAVRGTIRAILKDDLWTRITPLRCAALATTSVTMLGGWQLLPAGGWREAASLLVISGLAAAGALAFEGFKMPTRKDALDLMDRKSGRDDRPATQFNDRLTAGASPEQQAVWGVHRERLAASIGGFRSERPEPSIAVKDPFAIRHALFIATVAAAATAWGHYPRRIDSAFDWTPPPPAPVLPAVEAWLTPPDYTGQPPVSLYHAQHDAVSETKDFTVPAGTVVTIHIYKDKTAHVFTQGGAVVPEQKEAELPDTIQNSFQLNSNANIYIEGDGQQPGTHTELRWRFAVAPAVPPEVTVTGAPVPVKARPDAFGFPYSIQSEYGASPGEARITVQNTRQKPAAPQLVLPAR